MSFFNVHLRTRPRACAGTHRFCTIDADAIDCDDEGYWVSAWNFGLNQGPIVLMIENQRSDLVWRLMRQCPYIVQGLRRAAFLGGWL